MKVLVTGGSGMVGRGVVLECLDDPRITTVVSIGRSPLSITHSKLMEVHVNDMMDLGGAVEAFADCDACFYCMGVTVVGKTEEDYRRLTYDFAMSVARAMIEKSPQCTFIYVSGEGTDSSETGRSMWARVKGKTENDIMKMGFKNAYAFRPGAIIPERGITSKTLVYKIFLPVLKVIGPPIMKIAPRLMTSTTRMGKAMINVAENGYSKAHLNSTDINKAAQSL